jgi:hypothetical protein
MIGIFMFSAPGQLIRHCTLKWIFKIIIKTKIIFIYMLEGILNSAVLQAKELELDIWAER